MGEFAGYDMPIIYKGIIDEHNNCRTNACIFDVSHMGQVRFYGKDSLSFLESLTVGDLKELKNNSASLTVFTNERGGIIDDSIITKMPDFMNVVINAGCKDKDLAHFQQELDTKWNGKDVKMEVIDRSLIALQGPKAAYVLQELVAGNLHNLSFMNASFMDIPTINENVLISRCGYTGND